MSETTPIVRTEGNGGTTDEDRRTALRFVLGRPGWRVETRAIAKGETCLCISAPCFKTGRQRRWRVARTEEGLLIHDEAPGRRSEAAPTMRDALVQIWEAATGAAPY